MKTGFSSSKRPLVTSTITGAPGPEIRASLICRSERPTPGCDQVSQSPSGEKARSRTGPLTERISSVSPGCSSTGAALSGTGAPVAAWRSARVEPLGAFTAASDASAPVGAVSGSPVSRSSSRPSWEAIARRSPSGSATISWTRPSCPVASLRGGRSPLARGRYAISTASGPSASVTYATRPPLPSISGSRTRTPGVSAMVRAGPSRWVSQ